MANTITAGNGTNNGLAVASDNTGALNILTGSGAGTAAISIDGSQNVTMAANQTVTGNLSVTGNTTVTGTLSATNGITGSLKSATAQASTSGTSIDFTGIPAGVKRITVILSGVSTNGTSLMQIQIGSGSVTTSGYLGTAGIYNTASTTAFTAGFGLDQTGAAASIRHSLYTICLLGSNIYVGSGVFTYSNTPVVGQSSGSVTLGGAIDRVRITTVNGTDTFDAGSINIIYE
jgi:hypothetical protein